MIHGTMAHPPTSIAKIAPLRMLKYLGIRCCDYVVITYFPDMETIARCQRSPSNDRERNQSPSAISNNARLQEVPSLELPVRQKSLHQYVKLEEIPNYL